MVECVIVKLNPLALLMPESSSKLLITKPKRRFCILVGALGILLTGCSSRPSDKLDFTIAAASDLRYAMDKLAPRFQARHPQVTVKVSYGSSGQFSQQIAHGAPYDVFCSADLAYPRSLAAKGLTLPGSEFIYGIGRIVIWAPSESPLDVEQRGFDSLRDSAIRYIAIANPAHAPYGKAAVAALQTAGMYEGLKGKFAFGESVSATLQYVQRGSAEVGIVALALALAPPVRETGRYWEIPLESYPRLEQGGAIIKSTKHAAVAQDFRLFMLSEEARAILDRYGFSPTAATPR